MPNIAALESDVWNYVLTLRDSPEARLNSRRAFYLQYGRGNLLEKYGYGDSEIAFIKWEERGVLKPHPHGSQWWSEVNLWFIFQSELGKKAYEIDFPIEKLPTPAQLWVNFIEEPSSKSWYKAHNSSIIDGYLKYPDLAKSENSAEIAFINMVLYRLMFAQSMVEGATIFPKLSEIIANPKGPSVDLITHFDEFYPTKYPLTDEEIADIMGRSTNLEEFGVKFLDAVIIEPELTTLYNEATKWNKQPGLTSLIVNHKPAYPLGVNVLQPKKGIIIQILIFFRKLFLKKSWS